MDTHSASEALCPCQHPTAADTDSGRSAAAGRTARQHSFSAATSAPRRTAGMISCRQSSKGLWCGGCPISDAHSVTPLFQGRFYGDLSALGLGAQLALPSGRLEEDGQD